MSESVGFHLRRSNTPIKIEKKGQISVIRWKIIPWLEYELVGYVYQTPRLKAKKGNIFVDKDRKSLPAAEKQPTDLYPIYLASANSNLLDTR